MGSQDLHPAAALGVVDGDDLVDPANERGHFHVDAGHVFPAAAEPPGHEAGQLVVAGVLAHKGAPAIALKTTTI